MKYLRIASLTRGLIERNILVRGGLRKDIGASSSDFINGLIAPPYCFHAVGVVVAEFDPMRSLSYDSWSKMSGYAEMGNNYVVLMGGFTKTLWGRPGRKRG